jgi:glycosyltransferase involved in cell wall biosynthesis
MPILVVHIIIDLGTGGAELMLKRLVAGHRSSPDYRHRVISLRTLGTVGPEIDALGVPIEALGMTSALDLPEVIVKLVRRLREWRPDVVHTWMYHANLLGGWAARIAGHGSIIWAVRTTSVGKGAGVSRLTEWLQRISAPLSARLSDVIVYVAEAARRSHEALGYARARGLVIPNGYAIPVAVPFAEARSRLSIPADALVIGSVGRFNDAKDPRTFVEAAALVAEQHANALFVMVGRGFSTSNPVLTGWISGHRLEDRFLLLEEQKDVYDTLYAMDVFCLHSVTEAFPNVVAEAMNAALPCVVTDVGDAALLLDGSGHVVPPRNPAAIAWAIHSLIEAGPEARAALGQRGRQRIVDHFSIEAVVQQYEDLYRNLVAKPGTFPATPRRLQA